MIVYYALLLVIAFERLAELVTSHRHAAALLRRGGVEGAALPLAGSAWITACVFTAGKAALLTVRLRCETRALAAAVPGSITCSAWAAALATTDRCSGDRSTMNRHPCALAPEGAQGGRLAGKRASVMSSTGSSVKRRIVRAVDITSHTSLVVPVTAYNLSRVDHGARYTVGKQISASGCRSVVVTNPMHQSLQGCRYSPFERRHGGRKRDRR